MRALIVFTFFFIGFLQALSAGQCRYTSNYACVHKNVGESCFAAGGSGTCVVASWTFSEPECQCMINTGAFAPILGLNSKNTCRWTSDFECKGKVPGFATSGGVCQVTSFEFGEPVCRLQTISSDHPTQTANTPRKPSQSPEIDPQSNSTELLTATFISYLSKVKENPTEYFSVYDAKKAEQFDKIYFRATDLHNRSAQANNTTQAGTIAMGLSPVPLIAGIAMTATGLLVPGILLTTLGSAGLISGAATFGVGTAQIPRLQQLNDLIDEYNSLDPRSHYPRH